MVEELLQEEVETMMRSGREEILGEKVEKLEVLRCPSLVCRMTNLQRMLCFFVSVIPLCTIIICRLIFSNINCV